MNHAPSIPEAGRPGERRWQPAPGFDGIEGLVHGFTFRGTGDFRAGLPPPGWPGVIGVRRLRLLEQVHGTRIVRADDPGAPPRADGWAGRPPPGVLLGIRTADCLAVLFVHPPSRTIALAHAGWRGATAGVAEKALDAMGCPPDEIRAALGPAIGPCCYQVGSEVAAAAGPGDHLAPWDGAPHRYRLDLHGLVASRLAAAGVQPAWIGRVEACTSCRTDQYFSYRRKRDTGRLCAFLGWACQ